MTDGIDPRATQMDLTGKARIRNAALDLYAQYGEDRTSMRAIAAAAGVNVGLLVHYYKTKDGIREAVEQLVLDYFVRAISSAHDDGTPREVAAARDTAVQEMLQRNPTIVNYLRRTMLEPERPRGGIFARLTDLARAEIGELRAAGLASTERREVNQIVGLMMRQYGQLFLQPMLDGMWDQLAGPDAPAEQKPTLTVQISERHIDNA
ncbi:MAG: TetR/AcrR family transcriptional regulator [Mycobacterium sp.]